LESRRYAFNRVHFDAPVGWIDLSIVTLAGPSKVLAPTVVLTRDDAQGSPEAYAKRQLPDLKKQLKAFVLEHENPCEVAGRPAYRLAQLFTTPEKQRAHQQQYFLIHHGEMLVLTLTCAESERSLHQPLFDRVKSSLVLEGDA